MDTQSESALLYDPSDLITTLWEGSSKGLQVSLDHLDSRALEPLTGMFRGGNYGDLYDWFASFNGIRLWREVPSDGAAAFLAGFVGSLIKRLPPAIDADALLSCADYLQSPPHRADISPTSGIRECLVLHLLAACYARRHPRVGLREPQSISSTADDGVNQYQPYILVLLWANRNKEGRLRLDGLEDLENYKRALVISCQASTIAGGVITMLFGKVQRGPPDYELEQEYLIQAVRGLNTAAVREILRCRPNLIRGTYDPIGKAVTHDLQVSSETPRCPWIHHKNSSTRPCDRCQFLSHRPNPDESPNFGPLPTRLDLFCQALLDTNEILVGHAKVSLRRMGLNIGALTNLYNLARLVLQLYTEQPGGRVQSCSGRINIHKVCSLWADHYNPNRRGRRSVEEGEALEWIGSLIASEEVG